jgi:hypothetical protein
LPFNALAQLYRVWGAWNKNYPVMILPVLLYVASTGTSALSSLSHALIRVPAMSMLTMYGLSHPRARLFLQSTNVLTISLIYFTLAISREYRRLPVRFQVS